MKSSFLFTLLSVSLFVNAIYAQCIVTPSSPVDTVVCGDCINLSVFGRGQGDVVFAENFNSGTPTGWAFTQQATFTNPCSPQGVDGTTHIWFGNSSGVPRTLRTVNYDFSGATAGATVCFDMLFSTQGDNAPCEGPDEPDEGVYLQYSIDNGATWVTLNYFDPNGGNDPQLVNWNNWCFQLPQAALTSSTSIRWFQDNDSGADFDHWGIDNVIIYFNDPTFTITVTGNGINYSFPQGSSGGEVPQAICPRTTETYTFTMTNTQGATCTTDITVYSRNPEVFVSAEKDTAICPGNCVEINAEAKVIKSPAKVITFSNNEFQPIASTFGSVTAININTQGLNQTTVQPGLIESVCIDNLTFFGANFFPPGQVGIEALELALVCPDGTRIILVPSGVTTGTQTSGYANTCFVPAGGNNIASGTTPYTGNFSPNQPFSNLNGCTANGLWSLEVRMTSAAGFGFGTFFGWNITFDDPEISYPGNFSWNPTSGMTGETTLNPTVCPTSATTYTITASDTANCVTRDAQVSVTIDPTCCDIQFTATATAANCTAADGGINLNMLVGSGDYTFSWSNGATTQNVNNVIAGNYTVTVTDLVQNCSKDTTIVVESVSTLEVDISNIINPSCLANDGSFEVTISGGNAPFSAIVTNGANQIQLPVQGAGTYSLNNLSPGNYVIEVTDDFGCVETDSITLAVPDKPEITLVTAINLNCFNDESGEITVDVSGGEAPYLFNWSNGATTQNIDGLEANDYTLIVVDNASCSDTLEVTISEPDELIAEGLQMDILCFGDNNGAIDVTVNGGTTPYTFNWNTGDLTEDLDSLAEGLYNVVITDANGCETDLGFELTEPGALEFETVITAAECGESNGGVVVNLLSGGVPQYTFEWNNGNSPNLENVAVGFYSVTLTDGNGCTASRTVYVPNLNAPEVTLDSLANVTCNGGNNGYASVSVSEGVIPYVFEWVNTISSDTFASNLSAGNYLFQVTDAEGCITQLSIDIQEPAPLTLSVISVNTECEQTNGSIDIAISGGTSPYEFLWSNAETTEDISGLAAGDYSLTVTDVNECEQTSSIITIGIDGTLPEPIITVNGTIPFCEGDSVTLISNNIDGNIWNTGATTQSITVSQAGDYSVFVSRNDCESESSDTISVFVTPIPDAPVISVNGPLTFCEGENVVLTSSYTSGNTWNTNETSQSITATQSGSYSVSAVVNGCPSPVSEPVDVTVNAIPQVNISSEEDAVCEGGSLVLQALPEADTYLWSNGATTQSSEISSGGIYSVTVSTAGCNNIAEIEIESTLLPSVSLGEDTTICDGESLVLNAFSNVAESYNWSTAENTSEITVSSEGLYSVAVSNICGTITDEIQVNIEGCACRLMLPDAFTPDGDGKNDVFKASYDCSISNYLIRIYNRWGQLVFETNNPDSGWDGFFENSEQPIGTYVYYVEYTGIEGRTSEKRSLKGALTLIR